MQRLAFTVLLLTVFSVGLTACGIAVSEEEQAATFESSVDATVRAEVVERAVTQTVVQLSATATFTPTLTPTSTPTPTATPAGPIAILNESVACFSGPGEAYLQVAQLEAGLILSVEFLDDENDFLGVIPPGGPEPCWLPLDFAELRNAEDQLPAATVPPTPTPSLTPTPSVIWRGDWQIWVGPEPLTLYSLSLTHDGLQITGTFDGGAGNTVSIRGTLSADYTEASGLWTSSAGASGNFFWERKKNPNQFIGNQDNGSAAWCGARDEASIPSPCFGP